MVRLSSDKCPRCGFIVNAATGVDTRHAPKPWDFSLCGSCAELLRFDSDLRLVRAPDNWRQLLTEEQVRQVEQFRKLLKARRPS